MIEFLTMPSPVGQLLLVGNGAELTHCHFPGEDCPQPAADWRDGSHSAVLCETQRQLQAYFAGELRDFTIPLAPTGTLFQQQVWQQLRLIPYAATWSYGELARRVGNPKASRAVGLANGKNPLSIIVPCHRVIGANGSLVGYGGGLERKILLLNLEKGRQPLDLPVA